MADGIGFCFLGNFNQSLGDQGTRNGCAKQVLALVECICSEHWEYIVTNKFFAQVFNEDVFFFDAHLDRFGSRGFDLFPLTNVSGEGHHLTTVLILEPFQNDRGIKSP